jgi:hypothetical protein
MIDKSERHRKRKRHRERGRDTEKESDTKREGRERGTEDVSWMIVIFESV